MAEGAPVGSMSGIMVSSPGCAVWPHVQGWPQERVLVSEVGQGRLLMVLQTDPANHVKKVCSTVSKLVSQPVL
jgi:hypothetical protein